MSTRDGSYADQPPQKRRDDDEMDDDKDGDDGSHSDSSEVAFSDVNRIGLEKMYNQFQGTPH